MKKPRKPKPKAKRPAPGVAGGAPRRALAPAAHPRHRDHTRQQTARARATRWLPAIETSARRGLSGLTRLAERAAAGGLRTQFKTLRTATRTIALPYSRDERQVLLLLFLPVLLVASAIVAHQSMRTLYAYVTLAATHAPEQEVATLRPDVTKTGLPPMTAPPEPETHLPVARETAMDTAPVRPHAGVPETEVAPIAAPGLASGIAAPPPAEAQPIGTAISLAPAVPRLPSLPETAPPPTATPPSGPRATLALLNLAPAGLRQSPVGPAPVEAFEADDRGQPVLPGICTVADAAAEQTPIATGALPVGAAAPASLSQEAFGLRLAEAAEAQTTGFVVYNDAYRSIAYPMGDVHRMFGVCTDVVVRAYRTLGIDLQALVHQTRSGRGDRNIDHRRTEVLRRFFATHGESLPGTSFAEDYRPGDIVTYHRPQNTGSRAHIAVVSSRIAPSGRPMIVHNRGWGPQLEDALFVDRITGHYRYRGPETVQDASAGRARGASAAPATSVAAAAIPIFLPAPAN